MKKIIYYIASFFLICNYSFAQNSESKCEFDSNEKYKIKILREKVESYYNKTTNEGNDCKKIIDYYECYKSFLKAYEKKRALYNFFRGEKGVKTSNLNKLKKKKGISDKDRKSVEKKYIKAVEDCKPIIPPSKVTPIPSPPKPLPEARKESAFKLQKARQIIKSTEEGQYIKIEEIRQIGTDLYVDVAYFLKDEFPLGYHIFPDYSQTDLRKLLSVFKDFLKENESNGLYESAIIINITGYADSISVGDGLKYNGFTENLKDCQDIKENYYLLDSFNDTLPNYKDKSLIECEKNIKNNEELSLTRTIHPRNIIKEVLPISEVNLYALPIPDKEGGTYRRVEIQYLVPDYFLSEMEGVSEEDKKTFNKLFKKDIQQNFKIFRLVKNKK